MNLESLRKFISNVVDKFVKADTVINGLTAKNKKLTAERDNAIQERDRLKALVEALEAENVEEAEALKEGLASLDLVELPEMTTEETEGEAANDAENNQQFEDEFVQVVIDEPSTEFTADDAPTVGTPDETTTDVLDAATGATVDAISGDIIP